MDLILGLGSSPGGGHSSPLQYSCRRISWTEEPGGLQSIGHKELDMTEATEHSTWDAVFKKKKKKAHSVR